MHPLKYSYFANVLLPDADSELRCCMIDVM